MDPGIEELAENFQQQLKVPLPCSSPLPATEEVEQQLEGGKSEQASDDGYISSGSTENLVSDTADRKEQIDVIEEKEANEKKVTTPADDDDDDDEKILEPLVIIDEKAAAPAQPGVEFISRGPVSVDQFDHRYSPYARPLGDQQQQGDPLHHQPNLEPLAGSDEDGYVPPKPILLVYTKKDRENPTRLDGAPIEWSDKHELCIAKFPLPEDTAFDEGGGASCTSGQVQIFVQLNPASRDTNTFLAHVKAGRDEETGAERHFIGPIVISLKRDLATSMEKLLLKEMTEEERVAAIDLVNKKEVAQLVAGIGPHRDTVLSILSAQRKAQNPGRYRRYLPYGILFTLIYSTVVI